MSDDVDAAVRKSIRALWRAHRRMLRKARWYGDYPSLRNSLLEDAGRLAEEAKRLSAYRDEAVR